MMARNQAIDRIIDGINQGTDAWSDLARAGGERMYRLSRIVVDEAQRTQHERADLLRQFMEAPTDVGAFTNAVLQTWTRRSRRRMELTRTLFDDLRDAGADTRSLWVRMRDAAQESADGTADAGREVAARAGREVARRADDVSDAADGAATRLRREARRVDPTLN